MTELRAAGAYDTSDLNQLDAEPALERRRTFRALVVEHDDAILRLVRHVLEREGFSVEGTRSRRLITVTHDLFC